MFRSASKLLLALGLIASLAEARPPFKDEKKASAPAPEPVAAQHPAAQPAAPAQQGVPAPQGEPGPAGEVKDLEVQALLDRTGFSPGVIDGKIGGNTRKALAAFQEAHDLPVTGELDPATWESLSAAASGPALVEYTVTPEDAGGPFVPQIPEDMLEKARLERLAYTSTLELLGEKFHVAPDLLRTLNPDSRFAAGERIQVPNVRTRPPAAEKGEVRVVVSKENGTLVVERGGDVLFFAPVTAGSEHDPLPLGDWEVRAVAENPTFHYNPDLFWDADPAHSKAKVPPGPNNPVGVVWIDLSKDHYGIHGTPEPSRIGYSFSHGCVRLTNWDAMTLARLVKPGTPVLFRP